MAEIVEYQSLEPKEIHRLTALENTDPLVRNIYWSFTPSMIASKERKFIRNTVLSIVLPATITRSVEAVPSGSNVCRSRWNCRRFDSIDPFLLWVFLSVFKFSCGMKGVQEGAVYGGYTFIQSTLLQLRSTTASHLDQSRIGVRRRVQWHHTLKKPTVFRRRTTPTIKLL